MKESDVLIRKEIFIRSTPELVFRHLTEVELVTGWGGLEAELKPEPGGIYRIKMGGDFTLRGEFMEVRAPGRLVYSWGWEGSPLIPPGSTRVEITLEAEGEGTRLVLTHFLVPPDERERTEGGWEHYTARLKRLIETGDAGPDALAPA